MATLELRSLSRMAPPDGVTIDEASFAVREGRVAVLLGPAGAGKTTLLRLIAGLDAAHGGDVLLDDASILRQPARRRGVGLMSQDRALFMDRDIAGNVSFGLRMFGWPRVDREHRVYDLLELVGLAGCDDERIETISDIAQHRVALARTLAPQPSVLLLDDPLGTIDEALKDSERAELRTILQASRTTTVVASQDLRDATAFADDLIVMHAGRVLQSGALADVLGAPGTAQVAELLGYVTLAHGTLRDGQIEDPEAGRMAAPGVPPAAEAVRVLAHPSTLLAVPADTGLGCGIRGIVVRARPVGPVWVVDLAVGRRMIEARWEWDLVPPPVGTRLGIAPRPGTLRMFPAPRPSGGSTNGTPTTTTAPPSYVVRTPRGAPEPESEAPADEVAQRHRGMPLD